MRVLKWVVTVIVAIALVAGAVLGGIYFWHRDMDNLARVQLDRFYTPPVPLTGDPGDMIRTERAPDQDVAGAVAYRMLYVTESVTGGIRASSGMYWLPKKPAKGERKVIAWAHQTVGLGTDCVPSRNPKIGAQSKAVKGWLSQMAKLGWVVTATDYAGFGTPPPYTYLVGGQEARDVVNSVRAVRGVDDAQAGREWGVFGYSQGGHSALWTGELAQKIAPELDLVGVAAAAPAAMLSAIVEQRWNSPVGWVIGPEVVLSWPPVYPDLNPADVLSVAGTRGTESEAMDCIKRSSIMGAARQFLGRADYFAGNPLGNAVWAARLNEETPKPLPSSMPLFVSQGTTDTVVMSNTNSLMQKEWCAAGSDLTMEWMGGINHTNASLTSGPAVVDWFIDVFDGKVPERNCAMPPPIKPYKMGSVNSDEPADSDESD